VSRARCCVARHARGLNREEQGDADITEGSRRAEALADDMLARGHSRARRKHHVARPAYADPPKVPQDYGAPAPSTPGGPLTVTWRVVLFPAWVLVEYALRCPIGWLVTTAEEEQPPPVLYDFFTFGDRHQVGVFPSSLFDFGLLPSVGFNGYWKEALARENTVGVHFGIWGRTGSTWTHRIPESDFRANDGARRRLGCADHRALHKCARRRGLGRKAHLRLPVRVAHEDARRAAGRHPPSLLRKALAPHGSPRRRGPPLRHGPRALDEDLRGTEIAYSAEVQTLDARPVALQPYRRGDLDDLGASAGLRVVGIERPAW
jgi:hypothetical protein